MGVVKSVQLVVNDWVVSKLLKGYINLHSLALVQRCISSILSKNEEYYVGIENEMKGTPFTFRSCQSVKYLNQHDSCALPAKNQYGLALKSTMINFAFGMDGFIFLGLKLLDVELLATSFYFL